MTAADKLTPGDFENLIDLRACSTRAALKHVWLSLTDEQRAAIRWNPGLARHATSVLAQDQP